MARAMEAVVCEIPFTVPRLLAGADAVVYINMAPLYENHQWLIVTGRVRTYRMSYPL